MARGHQKALSQQRNAQKKQEQSKSKGSDQKNAAKAALKVKCAVCMTEMPDELTYKEHFLAKHPKVPLPAHLAEIPEKK